MKTSAAIVVAASALMAPRAEAFCGFYVDGAGSQMFADATQVVLMRDGTRTVLSMQNNYQGPAEEFALVIPVPVVLHAKDVKTLPREVFDRIDALGAPRLVEYWERDPCEPEPDPMLVMRRSAGDPREAPAWDVQRELGVKIEAKFAVGEYQIVILSASDSTGLDTWLREQNYQIPAGAEPYLRPYVEAGMKFFVARVDPKKVTFDADHRALLSPLRFHYDSDEFTLPIRLGLASSRGTQDLIVDILAIDQRYQVANHPNVTIPTNLDVKDAVRDRFGEFYAALFDRTLEKHPGAVVTEYAWSSGQCDPCPGPALGAIDLNTLGADVLGKKLDPIELPLRVVMTRLHARYGKDLADDLVFEKAPAIEGGREPWKGRQLEEGARPADWNNFQARYAIRHPWSGAIACAAPIRGRWDGPPPAGKRTDEVAVAQDLAFAPRGKAVLPELVSRDIPELGVEVAKAASADKPAPPAPPAPPVTPTRQAKAGCGCESGGGAEGGGLLTITVLAAAARRRRRPSTRGGCR